MIASISLKLRLDRCYSLKEKRGMLLPFVNRLRREFNVSVAEVGENDSLHGATLLCAMAGNDAQFLQSKADTLLNWVGQAWQFGCLQNAKIELIST